MNRIAKTLAAAAIALAVLVGAPSTSLAQPTGCSSSYRANTAYYSCTGGTGYYSVGVTHQYRTMSCSSSAGRQTWYSPSYKPHPTITREISFPTNRKVCWVTFYRRD